MDKRTFYAQASGGADLHGQHHIVAEESPNTVALVYDHVDSNGRATAQEIARRWNAHPKLVEALEYINGHWKSADEEQDIAYAIDLATCEKCKAMVSNALADVRTSPVQHQGHPVQAMAAFVRQVARMKTTDEAEEDLGNDEAMNGLIRSARAILNELNP